MTEQVPQQPAPLQTGPSDQPDLPRERRTHTSPERILAFKKLSLFNKLTLNKRIDQANLARERQSINHLMDPTNHPTGGSPTASPLTIEPDEIDLLRVPSVFEKLKDLTNASLHLALSKLPKKREVDPLGSAGHKRVCTLGTREPAERSLGIIREVTFDRVLFDTKPHSPLPLNFFLRGNLRYIFDIGSTLLKVKVNPTSPDSPTSAVRILDIEKLATKFGDDLSMSCSD